VDYLIHKTKKKRVAHLWNGCDTRCRMVSTGGLSVKRMEVRGDADGRRICKICLANKHPEKREEWRYYAESEDFPKHDGSGRAYFFHESRWSHRRNIRETDI
jgi:hypothetical protein